MDDKQNYQLSILFDYVYNTGYLEIGKDETFALEVDDYPIETMEIEFNDEFCELLKEAVEDTGEFGYGLAEFIYIEVDDWIKLSHIRNTVLDDREVTIEVSEMYEDDVYELCRNLDNDLKGNGNLSCIGHGYFSTVYRIGDYVWKVYKATGDMTWNYYRDDEILRDLKGIDYFPRLYASVRRRAFLVDYVEGTSFILEEFEEEKQNQIIVQLKEAIELALERGWIVSDLKEDNIKLDFQGNVIIVDVGDFRKCSELYMYTLKEVVEEHDELFQFYDEKLNVMCKNKLRELYK